MIKYTYRRQFKRVREDQSLFWENFCEELFDSKEEIDNIVKAEMEEDKQDIKHKWLMTVDYEIKEVEINHMEIEGLVSDYGEYEDYTVVVGETQIESLIINKFKGQKIKISIDVVE